MLTCIGTGSRTRSGGNLGSVMGNWTSTDAQRSFSFFFSLSSRPQVPARTAGLDPGTQATRALESGASSRGAAAAICFGQAASLQHGLSNWNLLKAHPLRPVLAAGNIRRLLLSDRLRRAIQGGQLCRATDAGKLRLPWRSLTSVPALGIIAPT